MARTVVVGAGVVGASIAYHLARAGADVVLVDQGQPASGATRHSFAWISADADAGDPVSPLRRTAVEDHRRLEAELPGVAVRWRGSLRWYRDEPVQPPATSSGPGSPGRTASGGRVVDAAAVQRLEPRLAEPPERARHEPGDGAVDPVALTEALVAGARRHGAELLTGAEVTGVALSGGRVVGVRTASGPLAGATVVLASGVGAAALCRSVGFALEVGRSPALLVRFSAPREVVRTLVSTSLVEVRQSADDELLVAWDHDGEETEEDLQRTARRLLDRLTATFHGADGLRLVSAAVGQRPMPRGGRPVVGPVPGAAGLHLAVMHSGVTLAPAVGRLVADELVHGRRAEELRPLRPVPAR